MMNKQRPGKNGRAKTSVHPNDPRLAWQQQLADNSKYAQPPRRSARQSKPLKERINKKIILICGGVFVILAIITSTIVAMIVSTKVKTYQALDVNSIDPCQIPASTIASIGLETHPAENNPNFSMDGFFPSDYSNIQGMTAHECSFRTYLGPYYLTVLALNNIPSYADTPYRALVERSDKDSTDIDGIHVVQSATDNRCIAFAGYYLVVQTAIATSDKCDKADLVIKDILDSNKINTH